jgi:hypothetical protein
MDVLMGGNLDELLETMIELGTNTIIPDGRR